MCTCYRAKHGRQVNPNEAGEFILVDCWGTILIGKCFSVKFALIDLFYCRVLVLGLWEGYWFK